MGRQRGHRRIAGEGDLAGDRLDETERQRVHVGLVVDLETQCLFGRCIPGDVCRDGCGFFPRLSPHEFRHGEVDDPQTRVGTEDQLRRGDLGVHHAAGVRRIERTARLQPHHQRLGGLEQSTAIEEITQTAPAEVLDDPEHGALAVDLEFTRIEDLCDVRVRQGLRDLDLALERRAERRMYRPFGTDDLDGHRGIRFDVDSLDDDRVRTRRHEVLDAVPAGQYSPFEAIAARCGWFRHLVVHSPETLPPEQLGLAAGIMEG